MIEVVADVDELDGRALHAVTTIVGADSHDIPIREALRSSRHIHTRETLAPKRCRCGEVHLAPDQADVLLHLGKPTTSLAADRHVTLAVLRGEREGAGVDCHWVAPREGEPFSPWAGRVIDSTLDMVYGGGVIGWDLDDLRDVLGKPKQLHFAAGESKQGVAAAAEQALASCPWLNKRTERLALQFSGPPSMRLRDISDIANGVAERASPDASIIFSATSSAHTSRVTLLGA